MCSRDSKREKISVHLTVRARNDGVVSSFGRVYVRLAAGFSRPEGCALSTSDPSCAYVGVQAASATVDLGGIDGLYAFAAENAELDLWSDPSVIQSDRCPDFVVVARDDVHCIVYKLACPSTCDGSAGECHF